MCGLEDMQDDTEGLGFFGGPLQLPEILSGGLALKHHD